MYEMGKHVCSVIDRACCALLQPAVFQALVMQSVVSLQDHLLPEEYVRTFRENLLDKCPVSSYLQVARTIDEEFGSPPSSLFAEFEEEPIASASLAQVGDPLALSPSIVVAPAFESPRWQARTVPRAA